jgi:hypothetical protein
VPSLGASDFSDFQRKLKPPDWNFFKLRLTGFELSVNRIGVAYFIRPSFSLGFRLYILLSSQGYTQSTHPLLDASFSFKPFLPLSLFPSSFPPSFFPYSTFLSFFLLLPFPFIFSLPFPFLPSFSVFSLFV